MTGNDRFSTNLVIPKEARDTDKDTLGGETQISQDSVNTIFN